jgi:hypothetical protein
LPHGLPLSAASRGSSGKRKSLSPLKVFGSLPLCRLVWGCAGVLEKKENSRGLSQGSILFISSDPLYQLRTKRQSGNRRKKLNGDKDLRLPLCDAQASTSGKQSGNGPLQPVIPWAAKTKIF